MPQVGTQGLLPYSQFYSPPSSSLMSFKSLGASSPKDPKVKQTLQQAHVVRLTSTACFLTICAHARAPWKPTPEVVRGFPPCMLALAAATTPPPRVRRFSNALAGFWKEARARPRTGCSLVPFRARMALQRMECMHRQRCAQDTQKQMHEQCR